MVTTLSKNCLHWRSKMTFPSIVFDNKHNETWFFLKVQYINKVNRGCVLGNTFLPVEASDNHTFTHIHTYTGITPAWSRVPTWGPSVKSGWYFITQPSRPQTTWIIQLLPYWIPCGAALLHCSWELKKTKHSWPFKETNCPFHLTDFQTTFSIVAGTPDYLTPSHQDWSG